MLLDNMSLSEIAMPGGQYVPRAVCDYMEAHCRDDFYILLSTSEMASKADCREY